LVIDGQFQETRPDDDVFENAGSKQVISAAAGAATAAATAAADAAVAAAAAASAAAPEAAKRGSPATSPWWVRAAREVLLSGDMPECKAFVLRNHRRSVPWYLLFWLDVTLRGVSQVYLCDHPVGGLLILLGLVCTSGVLAGYALLGTLFSTLGAHLVCRPPLDSITSGLCGYDGALVGCACWAFLDSQALPTQTAGTAVVLSFVSGIVHVALTNLLKQSNLPAFTFAFNLTTIAFLLSLKTGNAYTMPLAPPPAHPMSYPADYTDFSAAFLWEASVRGVGQFMFADTTEGGVLVILGICLSSRMGALAAWGGAAVAAITAVHLLAVSAASRVDVRNGLYGYNSAGTCASLAGGIFFDPTPSGAVMGVVGAAVTVLLVTMFKAILGAGFGLPVLTFPFIVSTWLMLLTRSRLLVPYPEQGPITRCELKVWRFLSSASSPSSWLSSPRACSRALAQWAAEVLLFPTVDPALQEEEEEEEEDLMANSEL